MAERTDTEQKVATETKEAEPDYTLRLMADLPIRSPATIASESLEVQKRTADALTMIANALTPAALGDTLTGFAKAQAVGQIASAMVAAASKNGLDSRNWQRIETETAHLLGNVFDKVMQHLTARAKGDVDPELKDAESGYKQWLEGNDPGDESDGK